MNGVTCQVCGASSSTTAVATNAPDPVTGQALAGWWRRVGATFADDLVLILPYLVLVSLFAALMGSLGGVVVGTLAEGLYFVNLLGSERGQTIGNRVAATRVRDAVTGQAITKPKALVRWGVIAIYTAIGVTGSEYGVVIVGVIGLADILYPLFNARKQTIHDRIAGTIVILA